jgi:hypothetical protein
MKLRCWPGCQALIVKGAPANVGKTVRCLRLLTPADVEKEWLLREDGPWWQIDTTVLLYGIQGPTVPRSFIPDNVLVPITPPEGTDVSDADVVKPVELEV